jgi:ABC-type molybdate transport system substrate-binding protein
MTSLFTAAGASPAACFAASATALVALLGGPNQARSDEIKLLSAAVMQPAFKETIDEFERASGHKLIITYRTMGAITERMLGGETADLVIGSTPSISRLVKERKDRRRKSGDHRQSRRWHRSRFGYPEAGRRIRR